MARWGSCDRCQRTSSLEGLEGGLCAVCRRVVAEIDGQLGLFHTQGDEMSEEMAEKVRGTVIRGQRLRLLAHLRTGRRLSDEQLQELTGLPGDSERPARIGLERSGLIERAGEATTRAGNRCHTYRITELGAAVLAAQHT